MEKFSQFTSQGVNPFVTSFDKANAAAIALCVIVVILRLPLIVIAAVLLSLSSAISSALPVFLLKAWRKTLVRLSARLALYALGVWNITRISVEKHSVRSRPSLSSPQQTVHDCDIIVSNHSSWVDVLVLAALYAPQFMLTSLEGGLRQCTIVEAMLASLKPLPARLGPAARETVHLFVTSHAHAASGPLVIFPEVRFCCNILLRKEILNFLF